MSRLGFCVLCTVGMVAFAISSQTLDSVPAVWERWHVDKRSSQETPHNSVAADLMSDCIESGEIEPNPSPPSPVRGVFAAGFVERAEAGMRCPDGTFLPPLNGVCADDPIPRIEREAFMAPIGAIVGKYTDDTGIAWWVTEDGSAFTTRWVELPSSSGRDQRAVRLDQADRVGERFGVGI